MSEQVSLFVDRFVACAACNRDTSLPFPVGRGSIVAKKPPPPFSKKLYPQKSSSSAVDSKEGDEVHSTDLINNEVESRILSVKPAGECRICQEEDDVSNLEVPCACSGSLKFAHRKCIQQWCNEKGDATCEICCKPYEGDYIVPSTSSGAEDSFSINIGWDAGGEQRLHPQGPFSVASEHVFLESDYEGSTRANAFTAACFRSVAFILMILLLVRQLLSMASPVAGEDAPTFIMLFFLRTLGFFLPCYVMARFLNVLHLRCQRQDAALAAAEVASLLQSAPSYGMQV